LRGSKIVCTVDGDRVSKRKRWDCPEGSWPQKKGWVEIEELDGESDWSGLGGKKDWGWRQEVSFALEEIGDHLREQNGHLKRISHGLDRGSGAGSEEDSTIRE